ncbi:maleylpyruvate isomerase N-terminal domain-containing protein [Glycomyces arizonensis]|uniref:maleylpyruvate isomerase N-terminal domain-containing protein n=1 Tax=Glycomyces arizonensis TaxID=256035 RepID=UPI00042182CF|nr:maleylpyruvate isomerase N-terminal domain-containing protein [Glycomyces arizonensis]
MDAECTETMTMIAMATARLIADVAGMSDGELRAPSQLEGWTRDRVATHVARSGDAMCAMLAWARTGEGVPGYASAEEREAGIEAGAGRSAAELAADLAGSAARFTAEVEEMTDDAWDAVIETSTGATIPAREIPARRLVEVELHHTDLGMGYRPADWTPGFAEMELGEPMRTWRADRADR